MPNKYHVLKKVQGTWTPIFFPVLSADWIEGKLGGTNTEIWSGRWIFQLICSLLLISRCLESLVLENDGAAYRYSLIYILGMELFMYLEFVLALEKKIIRNFNWLKNGIDHGTPNTWFSEGSLWINCWNQVFSRSQCKQLYGPSMDIHKFRICELVLYNTYRAEHNSKLVSKLVLQIFILSQLSSTFNMSQYESGITGVLITNHSFKHDSPRPPGSFPVEEFLRSVN